MEGQSLLGGGKSSITNHQEESGNMKFFQNADAWSKIKDLKDTSSQYMKPVISEMRKHGEKAMKQMKEDIEATPLNSWRQIGMACLAEFLGVLFFVYIGSMSVGTGSATAIALAHGLTITALIMTIGQLSGGHFNPSITLGVMVAGQLKVGIALVYCFVQLFGGLVGAGLVQASLTNRSFAEDPNEEDAKVDINGGAPQLDPRVTTPGGGFFIEVVLTLVVVMSVLMTAIESRGRNKAAPVIIGTTIAVCIMAGLFFFDSSFSTGGCMNTARAFGPAVAVSSSNPDIWTYHWIYWLGPITGGLLAGILYRLLKRSGWSAPIEKRSIELEEKNADDELGLDHSGYQTIPDRGGLMKTGSKDVMEDSSIFEIDETPKKPAK
ncbi:aquaporin-8 [Lingula anatina]|uniref:Aquaporin-8 n=1 Tax=Lingula anatina TaxID=7574 RepID=A0A1S3IXQ1_LINAN|nr:aquaporin-8 [Lingula anatina]|eukprot:XP_013402808.1 aquaporin-8 [Lingula anatina]